MGKATRWLGGAAFVMVLAIAPSASAVVLDFDDLTNAVTDAVIIPDGYGGLNWDQFGVIHKDRWGNDGYENGTVSGNYTAFNRFANVATASDGIFNFVGAYLTAAWNTGLNINVRGFQGATLLYDTTVIVNTDGPTFFNFDYTGINSLVFRSFGGVNAGLDGSGTHFAMDNFTYNVSEPGSLALLGIGLFVFRLARRRRNA